MEPTRSLILLRIPITLSLTVIVVPCFGDTASTPLAIDGHESGKTTECSPFRYIAALCPTVAQTRSDSSVIRSAQAMRLEPKASANGRDAAEGTVKSSRM